MAVRACITDLPTAAVRDLITMHHLSTKGRQRWAHNMHVQSIKHFSHTTGKLVPARTICAGRQNEPCLRSGSISGFGVAGHMVIRFSAVLRRSLLMRVPVRPQVLFGKGLQSDTKPLVDIFADVLSHKFELRSAYASVVGQVKAYKLI